MYIVTYENGEENYSGPFEKIVLDSVKENGFVFLCSDPVYGVSRCFVSGGFEIVKDNYLEA